jgi:hypothetical protein
MSTDELPSWRERIAKQSIVEFVAAVTDPDSPDFVAKQDRVAVFDNDGTLWTERPVYAQLVFALDRAAELGHPTSLEELHAGGMAALIKLVALTHAGITTEEFDVLCRSWLASARHPRFGCTYPARQGPPRDRGGGGPAQGAVAVPIRRGARPGTVRAARRRRRERPAGSWAPSWVSPSWVSPSWVSAACVSPDRREVAGHKLLGVLEPPRDR